MHTVQTDLRLRLHIQFKHQLLLPCNSLTAGDVGCEWDAWFYLRLTSWNLRGVGVAWSGPGIPLLSYHLRVKPLCVDAEVHGLVLEYLSSLPTSVSSPSCRGRGEKGVGNKEECQWQEGIYRFTLSQANRICCWCYLTIWWSSANIGVIFMRLKLSYTLVSGPFIGEDSERNSCICLQPWDFHTPSPLSQKPCGQPHGSCPCSAQSFFISLEGTSHCWDVVLHPTSTELWHFLWHLWSPTSIC